MIFSLLFWLILKNVEVCKKNKLKVHEKTELFIVWPFEMNVNKDYVYFPNHMIWRDLSKNICEIKLCFNPQFRLSTQKWRDGERRKVGKSATKTPAATAAAIQSVFIHWGRLSGRNYFNIICIRSSPSFIIYQQQ